MRRIASIVALLAFVSMWVPDASAVTLKLASLAPKKSTWAKYLRAMAKELDRETGGAVEVQLFPGGVQGDEKEVIEKIRTGQLHMAAVTAVGLSKIVPDALIFQLPGLYRTAEDMDRVRKAVSPEIEAKMRAEGFVLLGWSDVGPFYYFTNQKVVRPADLKKTKMWVWTDDPIVQAIVRTAGASGRPMGVPSVTAALANGKIDGYVTSPLAAASLRWYNRTTHINPHPVAFGIGALVMSQSAYDALGAEVQGVLAAMSGKWTTKLTRRVRQDNRRTLELMAKAGYDGVQIDAGGKVTVGAARPGASKPVITSVPHMAQRAWDNIYRQVQNDLAERKVYSPALLAKVRKLVR